MTSNTLDDSGLQVVSTPFLQRAVVGLRYHRGYDIEKAISKHERLAKWLKVRAKLPWSQLATCSMVQENPRSSDRALRCPLSILEQLCCSCAC